MLATQLIHTCTKLEVTLWKFQDIQHTRKFLSRFSNDSQMQIQIHWGVVVAQPILTLPEVWMLGEFSSRQDGCSALAKARCLLSWEIAKDPVIQLHRFFLEKRVAALRLEASAVFIRAKRETEAKTTVTTEIQQPTCQQWVTWMRHNAAQCGTKKQPSTYSKPNHTKLPKVTSWLESTRRLRDWYVSSLNFKTQNRHVDKGSVWQLLPVGCCRSFCWPHKNRSIKPSVATNSTNSPTIMRVLRTWTGCLSQLAPILGQKPYAPDALAITQSKMSTFMPLCHVISTLL